VSTSPTTELKALMEACLLQVAMISDMGLHVRLGKAGGRSRFLRRSFADYNKSDDEPSVRSSHKVRREFKVVLMPWRVLHKTENMAFGYTVTLPAAVLHIAHDCSVFPGFHSRSPQVTVSTKGVK
jgi:hypothetical protein